MAEKGYFLKLGGIFLLGLVSLIIGGILFFLLLPFIVLIGAGILFLTLVFLAVWIVIYVSMLVGAAIVYFLKPMKVSKKPGTYSLKRTKEAGRRKKKV